jgi:hypothetical protein
MLANICRILTWYWPLYARFWPNVGKVCRILTWYWSIYVGFWPVVGQYMHHFDPILSNVCRILSTNDFGLFILFR